MIILCKVPYEKENIAEISMIARLLNEGHRLTNGTIGGDGGKLLPHIQAKANETNRKQFEAGRRVPARTQEQILAGAKITSELMKTNNPMKRPEVVLKNKEANKKRNETLGRFPKSKTKFGSPEWAEMIQERMAKLNTPENHKKIGDKLRGKPKTIEHTNAIIDFWAEKSGLRLNGKPVSLNQASKILNVDRKTIKDRAKRYNLSLQEIIDYYLHRAG